MEKKDKLSFWTKLVYGTGDLGFSMNNSIISAFFPLFMMDVIGMTPRTGCGDLIYRPKLGLYQ